MKKYFEILQKCALFRNISGEDLPALLSCLGAGIQSYDKKQTIFAEGTPAKEVGILLSGSAQIVQNDYFGNRSILANIEPPELFCEAFACAEAPETPVSVVAVDPCAVMLLDCSRVMYSCSNSCDFHRQIIFNLMKTLAQKNISLHRKLTLTTRRTTREKLMAYLAIQAKKHNSRSFEIPFDRQALADYLEVDRSGLSAEIGKLRSEGILTSRKNHFTLLI